MIDLHTHTKYSDGTWDVQKLLQEAEKNNVELLAITDHDTVKAHLELEMDTLNSIIGKLNGKIEELISFDLPNEHSVRNLLKIKKIEKTHYKYPRKFADMKKKPLQ